MNNSIHIGEFHYHDNDDNDSDGDDDESKDRMLSQLNTDSQQ